MNLYAEPTPRPFHADLIGKLVFRPRETVEDTFDAVAREAAT